ncbi:MAG: DUF1800 domain-containing protein [Thaumarchaeota archaeon]|nr:DUF1800 domain-containing protein [Nitrososphaerota archaeon]
MSLYGADMLKVVNASNSSLINNSGGAATLLAATPAAPMSAQLQVAHLLRRAGFGGNPSEQAKFQGMGFDAALDYLINYEQIDNSALDAITPNIRSSYSGTIPQGQNELNNLATWWVNRMIQTPRPLEEKMTLFWHNHFATANFKVQNGFLMYQQNQFLRANALGNFSDLLTGMTSDAAMLVWLDGVMNRKNNPNENYAREVMEVFSTGRGPYIQADVTNGAKAFTGFSINSTGQGVFNAAAHDTSVKTFLGQTGNFAPQDILDILVARPETATNLSTELFTFFGYPNPSPDLVNRLSAVYFDSGYSIKSMVQAIISSPEFVSNRAYLANVKSPTEYVVTALRSLNATSVPRALVGTMSNQGQLLFDPPSVFGWPSGIQWINTGSVMERYNFPINIQTTSQNSASGLNPAEIFGGGTPESAAVGNLVNTLFPDGMPSEVLSVIQSSTARYTDPTLKTKNTVRLAMASPFYNLN